MTRYVRASILSGLGWGGIALAIALVLDLELQSVWGGIVASPLIGWGIGAFVRPARRWSSRARSLLAIPTFFLAVWLFGVAAAVPVVVASPRVPSAEHLLWLPASFVVGVVGYHLWVVLIPLAIVNTRILLRLESDRKSERK